MSIQGIQQQLTSIQGIQSPATQQSGASQGTAADSFGEMLQTALKEVNELQNKADDQIEGLTTNRAGVTAHTAMVALEKADVAFQLMTAIRGKIIRAYEEVIRTQV